MKLSEKLPAGVTVDGRYYKMDFDFRNVLRMLDTLANDNLIPGARDYLALKCLTKRPRNVERVLPAVKALLFDSGGDKGGKQGEKVTSFEQDAGLIRAAFRQSYNIDLYRERLHWLEFTELLRNLPDGSRYAEVLSIRCRPMPAATKYNAKEREWLAKAKMQCALHLTEAEAAKQYDRSVGNVFAGLLTMMQSGVGKNGE